LLSWTKLNVDGESSQTTGKHDDGEVERLSRQATIDRLTLSCPLEQARDRIRNHIIENLASMDTKDLQNIIQLLEFHTGWPRDPSLESLSQFISLLSLITPSEKPKRALDRIIRLTSTENKSFVWVLSWVLCASRPLTRCELSNAILIHESNQQRGSSSSSNGLTLTASSRTSIDAASKRLEGWLRMLVDFTHDEIAIRHEISCLLVADTDTDKYLWNEARQTAHQAIAEFCAIYLALPSTVKLLGSMLVAWEHFATEQIKSRSAAGVVPPITPDGHSIVFYAVQALPYHMRLCPASYSYSDPVFRSYSPPQIMSLRRCGQRLIGQ
jgi:hypothetical protein